MIKRDKIFYAACGIFTIGIVFALFDNQFSIFLMVAAYLLRPSLHAFDLAPKYADERQVQIHSRAGNIAFIAVMMATVGIGLARAARGEYPDELHMILFIGIVARAVVGLLMAGDLRKTGAIIIIVIGLGVAAFALASSGFGFHGFVVAVIGLTVSSLGLLSKKFPREIAMTITAIGIALFIWLDLYELKELNFGMILVVSLLFLSAGSLYIGSRSQDESDGRKKSRTMRAIILSSITVVVAYFFFMITYNPDAKMGKEIIVNRNDNGEITMYTITGRGFFDYHKNGQLESCTLAKEDTLSGQAFAEGTVVHLTHEGILDWCFLQKDTEIQGHLCRGKGINFMTSFHPNGQLRSARLGRDEIIQGIPCAKYSPIGAGSVRFHANGKLSYCTLSKSHLIKGISFKKGRKIRFDENGLLLSKKEIEKKSSFFGLTFSNEIVRLR